MNFTGPSAVFASRASHRLAAAIVVLLVVWAGYPLAPAFAQEHRSSASQKQRKHQARARDERSGPPAHEHHSGLPLGRFPGGNLFRPLPEDRGPLSEGERDQLMRFVRERVPKVHQWLRHLRERDPAAFDRRLEEAAPRLRQLRRIFERDPQLGNNLVQYSGNKHRMWRARRAWSDSAQNPEARRRIHDAVRRMLAQNLQIETAVLDERARQLEEQREARVGGEFERLTSVDVDLAGEPEKVRELVEGWQDAQYDDERARFEDELWRVCSERADREVKRLRARAGRMRTNAVAEVDRRMESFISHAEKGAKARAGLQPVNGPEGDEKSKRGRRHRPRP